MIWQQWALLAYTFLGLLAVAKLAVRTGSTATVVRGLLLATALAAVVLSI